MGKILDLIKQRESDKLEFKTAKGGLPKDMWETYSAFANTNGGTIVLGVREKDGKNMPAGLTEDEAQKLVKNIYDYIHSNAVNANLINDKVYIDNIDDDFFVIIEVKKALNYQKPVYVGGQILNVYKRQGESDYRCSISEIQAMIRDRDTLFNDAKLVTKFSVDAIKTDTLNDYINRFKSVYNETHVFLRDGVDIFLCRIGAAGYSDTNSLHPTVAGLLMFGNEYDIISVLPGYMLDYQNLRNLSGNMRWSSRINSATGDWSGNLYDFFFRIINKLTEDIDVPFKTSGIFRVDQSELHIAIREALCNTLVNADYYMNSPVVVKQYTDKLVFINSGSLMVPLETMLVGGISNPRNNNVFRMFSLIDIAERMGSGIPLIFAVAESFELKAPTINQYSNPVRTEFSIYLSKDSINGPLNNYEAAPKEEKAAPKEEKAAHVDNYNVIINRINNIAESDIVKNVVKNIFELVHFNSFSRKTIIESNIAKRTRASEYIKIMLEHNLINKVGNEYKFIN